MIKRQMPTKHSEEIDPRHDDNEIFKRLKVNGKVRFTPNTDKNRRDPVEEYVHYERD